MRLLRGLAGLLLWVVALLLVLVGALLCVTVLLLPVGIPLIGYARRTFTLSMKLMLPRAVTHPVDTAETAVKKRGRRARKRAESATADGARKAKRLPGRTRKGLKRARKKAPLPR